MKKYLKMREVCEELELPSHTIRIWEKQFSQLQFRRNSSGHRIFSQEDLTFMRWVKEQVAVNGLTLEGVKKKLSQSPETRRESTTSIVAKVQEIKQIVGDIIISLDSH